MEVFGYKAFNSDFTNNYGTKFEVGSLYIFNNRIKNISDFKGYHFCKNMEDNFRYIDAMNKEIKMCYVRGSGDVQEQIDEYNGYYNKYIVTHLNILKELTRDEIIDIGLNLNDIRVKRFLSGFKLTEEELKMFETKFSKNISILKVIEYYQKNNLDVYKEGVKTYGQYSNKRS